MTNDERQHARTEGIFALVRRIVVFLLGVWVIVNALLHPDERISQLIVGMVMVGVLPIENIFSWRVTRRDD